MLYCSLPIKTEHLLDTQHVLCTLGNTSMLSKLCLPGMLQADGRVFVHRPGKTLPMSAVKQQAVWVSLAEAQAYCKWAGGRIMTEEEYARAAEHTHYDDR